ncbi:MAG: SOS response-associated peptidase [Chloroflexi bacterium]|nr:SOS response-associated peptidase [Chloroflexota bacterium]
MCGRFTLTEVNPEVLSQNFGVDPPPPDLPPRYNVAPSQPVATVIRDPESGRNQLAMMRWGLIPSWAKDASVGYKMINARAETVAEKPAYRTALSRRRCLIVADGFYEWQAQAQGPKVPMYITLADHQPFGFAGLWERWTEPESGEVLTTCTIITTEPNDLMATIHNRMPVILPREAYDRWLDPAETDGRALTDLLRPYPAGQMAAYPVSRLVNAPGNDGPELIQRAS